MMSDYYKTNYQIPELSYVTLIVYDMLGREVAVLQNGMKVEGYHSATFDASNLSSGVYFSRLIVQPKDGKTIVRTKKMVLTK